MKNRLSMRSAKKWGTAGSYLARKHDHYRGPFSISTNYLQPWETAAVVWVRRPCPSGSVWGPAGTKGLSCSSEVPSWSSTHSPSLWQVPQGTGWWELQQFHPSKDRAAAEGLSTHLLKPCLLQDLRLVTCCLQKWAAKLLLSSNP